MAWFGARAVRVDRRRRAWLPAAACVVAATACGKESYDVYYDAEARDAGGACSECDPRTLKLYGIISTDSPDPIVLWTPDSCLHEITLQRDGEEPEHHGGVCLTVESDWPVSKDDPVEWPFLFDEDSYPPGAWTPLPAGRYQATLVFATEPDAVGETEFTITDGQSRW